MVEIATGSSDLDDSGDERKAEDEDEPPPTPVVEEPVLSARRRQKKEAKLAAKLKESAKEEGMSVKRHKFKDGSARTLEI